MHLQAWGVNSPTQLLPLHYAVRLRTRTLMSFTLSR